MTRPQRRGGAPGCLVVASSLVAAVAGGLFLLAAFQDRMIFFPVRALDATPASLGLPFEEVTIETLDREKIAAWHVPANESEPLATVLFLHGNAGNRSHRLHAVEGFHSVGMALLLIDYRGYGGSTGSPTGPGIVRDAEASWAWLTEKLRIPPGRIVLYGESIGAVPALAVARRLAHERGPGPAALVLEGAFTSGLEMGRRAFPLLPVRWLLTDPMDNLAAIRDVRVPTFFLHAAQDEIVPFEMGRRLYETSSADSKSLRAVQWATHNTLWSYERRALFSEIAAFVRRAVAERESGGASPAPSKGS